MMFWLVMTIACLVWYSTITIYVSIKGYFDIKTMLRQLAADHDAPGQESNRSS